MGSGPNNGDLPTDGYGIDPYMFPEDKYLDNDYADDYDYHDDYEDDYY